MKSILKYAGSKNQNLKYYEKYLPTNILEMDTYVEPFVGSGAMFLYIRQNFPNFTKFHLSDLNLELINMYLCIQVDPERLYRELSGYVRMFHYGDNRQKEYYYGVREAFNSYIPLESLTDAQKYRQAALYLFLNKTSFNGLERRNKQGLHNVPWNKNPNPKFPSQEDINNLSVLLRGVSIKHQDYNNLDFDILSSNALCYIDSPYMIVESKKKATMHTAYTLNGFTEKDQIELVVFVLQVQDTGAKIMAANSICPLVDVLYKDFNQIPLSVRRAINSDGQNRIGTEYLILNYKEYFGNGNTLSI